MRDLPIKTKIIIVIVGLVMVFGALATYSVFITTKSNLVELEKDNLIQHTQSQGGEIEQVLEFAGKLSESIAGSEEIISILEVDDGSEDNLEHVKEHHLNSYNIGGMYSAIYIMDTTGEVVVSTMESFVGKDYSFRDYFAGAMTGVAYADVAIGVTSGELGYYFSHPVMSESDEIIGVVVVKLKPEMIERVFEHVLSSDNEMRMMLVDEYGVIIHSTDEDKYMHSLGVLSPEVKRELWEKRRYEGVEIKSADYNEIQSELDEITSEARVYELMDKHDEREEFLVIAKVEGYGFYVICDTEFGDLINLAIETSVLIAMYVLGASVLAGVSISFLVSRLLKPLSKLQKVVSKVEKGEVTDKIEVESNDEIGQLAKSFNKMIDSVVEARDGVEKKVAEQTIELEKQKEEANKARKMAEKVSSAMTGREFKMIELKKEIQKLKRAKNTKKK